MTKATVSNDSTGYTLTSSVSSISSSTTSTTANNNRNEFYIHENDTGLTNNISISNHFEIESNETSRNEIKNEIKYRDQDFDINSRYFDSVDGMILIAQEAQNAFKLPAENSSASQSTSQQLECKSSHQSIIMTRSQPQHHQSQSQSIPSPSMLMDHLALTSIKPPSLSSVMTSLNCNSSSLSTSHQNFLLFNDLNNTTPATQPSDHNSLIQNEICFTESNADDSSQSMASIDSSIIIQKAELLQVDPALSDEKLVNQVSKRIRFKNLIESKQIEKDSCEHKAHEKLDQMFDQVDIEQNPFAYRPSVDTFDDSVYSSKNMINCYSYAWRRWSKTDAPSVKNRAGSVQVPHTMPRIEEDGRKFQYILGAPTSAGTRVGAMTMTYLNQGQSYEIRLKKLKKVFQEPNLKTSIRLGFVEKRLQFRENEELTNWILNHKNGRMIDIDYSMSYGVFDIDLISNFNHSMTFVWNPDREASIFIKINCISTEFTSKRHGGEKGTPFRLIVDTFSVENIKLDSACCLIKVFKSKGAERKHKTDRDRVAKHSNSENYYQPSYDCTLLTTYKEHEEEHQAVNDRISSQNNRNDEAEAENCSIQTPSESSISLHNISSAINFRISNHQQLGYPQKCIDLETPDKSNHIDSKDGCHHETDSSSKIQSEDFDHQSTHSFLKKEMIRASSFSSSSSIFSENNSAMLMMKEPDVSISSRSTFFDENIFFQKNSTDFNSIGQSSDLSSDAGAIETYEWLKRHRFFRSAEQLCDYTAEDLRRLSRDDLIQICDFKDGIRLYNLIHPPQNSATKLTIFITVDGKEHHALYFKNLTTEEFRLRIHETLRTTPEFEQINISNLGTIHLSGPNGIRIKLTSDVIQNMKNESIYNCFVNKDKEKYDVIIESVHNH